MPLTTGQTLHNNRYRIVRLIGQGGFGAVYRAWDTVLNQPGALKENLDVGLEAQRQFEREATLMAGLRHPNLPRVIDHFFIPGQGQYLVMDFVQGSSIAALLEAQNGRPFNEADVLPWLQQVCNALDYLHNRQPPIIHRDIKPENIIITPEGQAMLVDFGLSKIYDVKLATTVGARAVTPGYSPPEQYGAGKTDARTDIYALGATLYRMLTGVEPPSSVDLVAGAASLTPPRQLNEQLEPAAEQAILQAMAVNMSQRFDRAGDFLDNLISSSPTASTLVVTPIIEDQMATQQAMQAAQWQEKAERAMQEKDWAVAIAAAQQWLQLTPNDLLAQEITMRAQAELAHPQKESRILSEQLVQTEAKPMEPNESRSTWIVGIPQATSNLQTSAASATSQQRRIPIWLWIVGGVGILILVWIGSQWVGKNILAANQVSHTESEFAVVTDNVTNTPGSTTTSVSTLPVLENTVDNQSEILEMTRTFIELVDPPTIQPVNTPTPVTIGIELELMYEVEVNDSTDGFNAVTCLEFSPDSKQFITCGSGLNVWNTHDGSMIDSWQEQFGHGDISYSPNGRFLAVAKGSSVMNIFNSSDGSLYQTLRAPTNSGEAADIYFRVDFSPRGELLAVGRFNVIDIWSTDDWELLETLEVSSSFVQDIEFSSSGQYLSIGNTIWRVDDWSSTFKRTSVDVKRIDFSHDSKFLAIAADWGGTQIIDPSNYELVFTDENQSSDVAFSPRQNLLASSHDEYVNLFLLVDGAWISRNYLLPPLGQVGMSYNSSIAFSLDGTLLAIGRRDGSVLLYKISGD